MNLHKGAVEAVCEHDNVKHYATQYGAVACVDCGRLFGHLKGELFIAHNPHDVVRRALDAH